MKAHDLPAAMDLYKQRDDFVRMETLLNSMPEHLSMTCVGTKMMPRFIKAMIPAVRAQMREEVRQLEGGLNVLGVVVVNHFQDEPIPSSSPTVVAFAPREGDEKAPNARPDQRIWWVASVLDRELEVKHFPNKVGRDAYAASILKDNWMSSPVGGPNQDLPALDDEQWITAWDVKDYNWDRDLTNLQTGCCPPAE